jgi:hypothetical protein
MNITNIEKKRINFLVSNEFNEVLNDLTLKLGGNKSLTIRTCIYDFIKRNKQTTT